MAHRWSGWPGAWCLDCGADDPLERALADGAVIYHADGFDIDPNKREQYVLGPCPEPGSNKHNPYHKQVECS